MYQNCFMWDRLEKYFSSNIKPKKYFDAFVQCKLEGTKIKEYAFKNGVSDSIVKVWIDKFTNRIKHESHRNEILGILEFQHESVIKKYESRTKIGQKSTSIILVGLIQQCYLLSKMERSNEK